VVSRDRALYEARAREKRMLQELNRTNMVRDSLLSLEQLGKGYSEGHHMRVLIEDLKQFDFEVISTNLPAE
jgi:hypothetical protein